MKVIAQGDNFEIKVNFETIEGNCTASPVYIQFPALVPGNFATKNLFLRNYFAEGMLVKSITSEDPRFVVSMKSGGVVAKNSK